MTEQDYRNPQDENENPDRYDRLYDTFEEEYDKARLAGDLEGMQYYRDKMRFTSERQRGTLDKPTTEKDKDGCRFAFVVTTGVGLTGIGYLGIDLARRLIDQL